LKEAVIEKRIQELLDSGSRTRASRR